MAEQHPNDVSKQQSETSTLYQNLQGQNVQGPVTTGGERERQEQMVAELPRAVAGEKAYAKQENKPVASLPDVPVDVHRQVARMAGKKE